MEPWVLVKFTNAERSFEACLRTSYGIGEKPDYDLPIVKRQQVLNQQIVDTYQMEVIRYMSTEERDKWVQEQQIGTVLLDCQRILPEMRDGLHALELDARTFLAPLPKSYRLAIKLTVMGKLLNEVIELVAEMNGDRDGSKEHVNSQT